MLTWQSKYSPNAKRHAETVSGFVTTTRKPIIRYHFFHVIYIASVWRSWVTIKDKYTMKSQPPQTIIFNLTLRQKKNNSLKSLIRAKDNCSNIRKIDLRHEALFTVIKSSTWLRVPQRPLTNINLTNRRPNCQGTWDLRPFYTWKWVSVCSYLRTSSYSLALVLL